MLYPGWTTGTGTHNFVSTNKIDAGIGVKKQVCAIGDRKRRSCSGMTLLEAAMVIAIMGILAGLGVSKLDGAIANARIKDAANNISAYMERTANESRRLSATLCVKRDDAQKLVTYLSNCANTANASRIDSVIVESPNRILNDNEVSSAESIGSVNFSTSGAEFTPKQGLSAAPSQGFFAVQYGGKGVFGVSAKLKGNNTFVSMMKFEDSSWSGI